MGDLQENTNIECDKYSNDVKYWAEYRTGIKEFTPWLVEAEKASSVGLVKPSSLDEVKALKDRVFSSDKNAANYLKVLNAANDAAQKMTTHSDEWVKKVDILFKEWTLLDNTVTELNSW